MFEINSRLTAPQSVSFLASFPPQPQPLSLQAPASWGGGGGPQGMMSGGPLYMSIPTRTSSSQYQKHGHYSMDGSLGLRKSENTLK